MKPKKFKEVNCTYAENQPEYYPLPGHKVDEPEGRFIFCMHMNIIERLRVLITGNIWCSLMTFKKPLTPSYFTTKKTDFWE